MNKIIQTYISNISYINDDIIEKPVYFNNKIIGKIVDSKIEKDQLLITCEIDEGVNLDEYHLWK